jgi:hypothetical protein
MNSRVRHLIAPVALLAVLAFVPSASASSAGVMRACLNEQSLSGFSDADKRAALNQLAADADEYSDCRSVIGASIGNKGGVQAHTANAGAATGAAPTRTAAQTRKAAARKRRQVQAARIKRVRKARDQKLGHRKADPQNPGVFKAASTANGMPFPIWLAVIALGLMALTAGLLALSRRNPRVAGVIRRVSPPRFRR